MYCLYCRRVDIQKHKLYKFFDSDSGPGTSIIGLRLGKGMIISVRMVFISFIRMESYVVHEVELESACLSGQGCGLCIALIRPNHWAASVAQWLEHLSSKQCVVGSNPTRAALFSFRRKKSCLG